VVFDGFEGIVIDKSTPGQLTEQLVTTYSDTELKFYFQVQ